jgi:hypothetical protein
MFDKEKFYKTTSEGFKEKKINEVKKLFGEKDSEENPKTIGKTNFERKREERTQRRAERRASKSGADKDSDQFKADVKAEKELIGKRRNKRTEFLKSFAANLAGNAQSSKGGTFRTKDLDAFGSKPGEEFNSNISDSEKATKMETEQNEEELKSRLDGIASKDNKSLGDIGFSGLS